VSTPGAGGPQPPEHDPGQAGRSAGWGRQPPAGSPAGWGQQPPAGAPAPAVLWWGTSDDEDGKVYCAEPL
jgi:hypothetical protein